jgi:hypothetical protein
MVLRFSRSAVASDSYHLERQAPSGVWSRRMPLNPQYAFELTGFEIPADQVESVQQQLRDLPPGHSITLRF